MAITRHRALLVCAVAAATITTACSGGNSGSTASGLKESPYVVYSTIPLSGSGVGKVPGVKDGGTIAAAAINASGGINGHPIEFVACDNKGTPADSQACGRQAVKDKAVATIENQDAFGGAIAATNAAGIPSLSNASLSQADGSLPTSFPTVQGPTSVASYGATAFALGAKKIRVAVFDGAAGDVIARNVQFGLTPNGIQIDRVVKVPTSAGDLSPFVAQLSDADAILIIAPPQTTVQLIRDLHQSNYQGKVVSSTSLVKPTDLQGLGAAADGLYVTSASIPVSDAGAPGVADFLADAKKYGGDNPATDSYAVEAWANLKMLAQVMRGLPTVTPQTLTAALQGAGQLEVKPMVPVDFGKPVTMFAPVRAFSSHFYVLKVADGKYTAVSTNSYDITSPPKTLG
jgi:branched-chain amino acid transport system substrate-binding protein